MSHRGLIEERLLFVAIQSLRLHFVQWRCWKKIYTIIMLYHLFVQLLWKKITYISTVLGRLNLQFKFAIWTLYSKQHSTISETCCVAWGYIKPETGWGVPRTSVFRYGVWIMVLWYCSSQPMQRSFICVHFWQSCRSEKMLFCRLKVAALRNNVTACQRREENPGCLYLPCLPCLAWMIVRWPWRDRKTTLFEAKKKKKKCWIFTTTFRP